jgi:hypothetical protein
MKAHRFALPVVGLVAASVAIAVPSRVSADGPGVGTPWVVTVGDSAISGEAGRWAGNSNQSSSRTDAGGADAYFDNATHTAEAIPGCHRSKAAEAQIGGGFNSLNIACSGARTYTQTPVSGDFKPGLDFYSDTSGRKGQALVLQEFAATHNVRAVTVLIGSNNFGFADVVQQCVQDFLLSPSWFKDYCYDDSSVASKFTATAISARTTEIKGSILNVRQAMLNAGYADTSYSIVVQTYSAPLPRGAGIRYAESGYGRQSTGGCGFWNRDADWANDTALPSMNTAVKNAAAATALGNVVILDDVDALAGRRLCENTVGLLEERSIATWQSAGAVDNTEWANQIRTVSTVVGPYQVQESLHPSYWGELALRNCLRQAVNNGAVRGGKCTRGANGLNAQGEPNMVLI